MHDEYVQILLDLGVLGLLLLMLLVALLVRAAAVGVARRSSRDPLPAGVLAALVAAAVHGGLDFVWHVPVVPLTAVALVAVTWRPADTSQHREGELMNRLRTRHPAALALLVGGALAALVPVGTAVALDSPPQATAHRRGRVARRLVARGARGRRHRSPTCAPPATSTLDISVQVVTQRSGREITSGSGSRTAPVHRRPAARPSSG